MKKQTLLIIKRHEFNRDIVDTCYNTPGDLAIYNKQPEDFEAESTSLVGIFSDNSYRDRYLNDKDINFKGSSDDSDEYGSYTRYLHISGHYHTATEKQLSTVIIKGKQYAECDNIYIEIDQVSSLKGQNQEQEETLIR